MTSQKKNNRSKIIHTLHGRLQAPFFMPDATRGFVKLIECEELKKASVEVLVVNTLHLYLQPGLKIIKKAGGIHKFMNWDKPILSDSGGFQVFSLIHKNPQMGKIYDDKVVFKSPLDGSKYELTPEKSIQIQFDLGTDMMVCLDDCPPNDFARKDLEKSVNRTIAWAKSCRAEYDRQIKKRRVAEEKRPLLFTVIQGGVELDLREKCVAGLLAVGVSAQGGFSGWDGYGFGARPVDKEGNFLEDILKFTADLIPKDSLRFALGVGLPEDIIRCVKMGWDMFDCVIPTREGRHGRLFLWQGADTKNYKLRNNFYKTININNAEFAEDFSPVNKNSKLLALRGNTKAYLRHLFKVGDPLGAKLASLNNLEFYMDLLAKIKKGETVAGRKNLPILKKINKN